MAWLVWETVPGGLAVAGNDFLCPGSHRPLEAATQRWHFQINHWTSPELGMAAFLLGLHNARGP